MLGWILLTTGLFDEGGSAVQVITIFRVCRVARVIRLAKRAEAIKALLRTLLMAIPAVADVAVLFFLLIYIFAIVGMHMFGRMPADGHFFDEHANFKNVGIGMLTLFRCATGESWNGIMYDLMDRSPDKLAALGVMVYFTVFTILGSMMMLNLIVAVVLEQFGSVTTRDRMPVTPVNIQQFNQAWTDVAQELYTTEVCEELLILKEKTNNERAAAKRELNQVTTTAKVEEVGISKQSIKKLRTALLPYLPIESLHYVLEKVPPPLGIRARNLTPEQRNALLTTTVMSLHTNIHKTPYSQSSVESFEVLVALAARKFKKRATKLPKNAVGLRAGIASAMQRKRKHEDIPNWGGDSDDDDGWSGGTFDDLTLGQLFNAVSLVQKNSRRYLKYLRAHVLELRQAAKRIKTEVPEEVEAVLTLQHWYKRTKSRHLFQELIRGLTKRMKELVEHSKNQNLELKELRSRLKG